MKYKNVQLVALMKFWSFVEGLVEDDEVFWTTNGRARQLKRWKLAREI